MNQFEPNQFEVEAVLNNYLVTGILHPDGELMSYLNDHRRLHIAVGDGEIRPLNDYTSSEINPENLYINRQQIVFVSLLNPETLVHLRVLNTRRPLLIYTDNFMIKGYIHINPQKPMGEIFDGLVDFFPVSDVKLELLHPLHRPPTREVPFMVLNRTAVIAYQKPAPQQAGPQN